MVEAKSPKMYDNFHPYIICTHIAITLTLTLLTAGRMGSRGCEFTVRRGAPCNRVNFPVLYIYLHSSLLQVFANLRVIAMFVLIIYVYIYAIYILLILWNCHLTVFHLYFKQLCSAQPTHKVPFVIKNKIWPFVYIEL